MFKKFLVAAAVAGIGILLPSLLTADQPTEKSKFTEAQVKRGAYLTTFGGCHDCHTPKVFTDKGPEPDMSRKFMGHPADAKVPEIPAGVLGQGQWAALANDHLTAWAGPWGISFAQNITPDMETGIGSWTVDMFIKALRTGKHMGEGRPILPPMPWPMFSQATDEDLTAVFAYLKSLPPIKNAVPDPIPPMASH